MSKTNYLVHIQDWNGMRTIKCYSSTQVWKAIGSRTFGGLYQVTSPTGKDCGQFIPL
jgi:hypothetical protein